MTADLVVPNPNERQHQRHVFSPFRIAEMDVHRLCAAQECVECIASDCHHQRQTDWPPHGIAAADPILEPEHTVGGDAEFSGLVFGCRQRGELCAHICHLFRHPRPCRACVGHRFNRRERLGRDDDKGCGRITRPQHLGDVRRVHVRHKVAAGAVVIRGQCQHTHRRA